MPNTLKIGCLNVQGGLCQKMLLPELISLIKKFDIFTFVETWLTSSDDINFNGYESFRNDRIKNKSAKRGSGGVCTLVKKKFVWSI